MKSLILVVMGALLLGFFFQCCPSAPAEAPPIEVPTEQAAPPPSQPLPEDTPAPPPPPEPTPTQPPPTPASRPVLLEFGGHGNEATQLFRLSSGLIRCDYTHDGEWNFIVYLLDEQGDSVALLANEIGACEGSSANGVRDAGNYLLDVTGDVNWTITLSQ